ncbi:hypothetical protein G4G28_14955 [Massilia sp. Dwa41.01b]|uniref:hypothetical protein n=1 Tax=unclassified Massilia TaxID=2609279 RepID=UPI00160335F3|nr:MULTISPECIES: hypothetical protein [unclassified Massilia]QNA89447.1 hypothetical protein G4G28_14955 [Massilia sp. Dwa41.01b]QNB00349.1 hypothetical protein G4G31_18535 [Massilia sp. Se16.2.3]
MSRGLLHATFCCCALAPLHAHAVWDYSLTEKLAIYDAVEKHCRPLIPAAFEGKSADKVLHLDAEDRSRIKTVRQSPEYREVLSGASDELSQQLAAAGKDGAANICKDLMDGN